VAAGRRRGGQPGYLNALKHGFYSKQLQEGEIADLEAAEGLKEEIGMMRLMTRRLFEMARGCTDMDELISVLGALGTASMRVASLMKVDKFLGGGDSVRDEISMALEDVTKEILRRREHGKEKRDSH